MSLPLIKLYLAEDLVMAETVLRTIVEFPLDESKSAGWHFAEVRQLARDYFANDRYQPVPAGTDAASSQDDAPARRPS